MYIDKKNIDLEEETEFISPDLFYFFIMFVTDEIVQIIYKTRYNSDYCKS